MGWNVLVRVGKEAVISFTAVKFIEKYVTVGTNVFKDAPLDEDTNQVLWSIDVIARFESDVDNNMVTAWDPIIDDNCSAGNEGDSDDVVIISESVNSLDTEVIIWGEYKLDTEVICVIEGAIDREISVNETDESIWYAKEVPSSFAIKDDTGLNKKETSDGGSLVAAS